jgi:UDP-glucose:(heptosyl)LPS alpha-1,3-glucosyltransferase
MRVVLVRRGWSATGGAESYLQRLASSLVEAGHEADLVGSGWPPGAWPHGNLTNLTGGSPGKFATAFSALPRDRDAVILSLERVPGCDVFRAGDGVHAAWLQRRRRFEPAWKALTRFLNPKHRALLYLEKMVLDPGRTRFIIANSRLVADEIPRFSKFPADRIFIVRNGFDPQAPPVGESERKRARQMLDIPPDQFVALFVGSGWERKGLRYALEATGRIGGSTLLVAGRGPVANFTDSHVRHLGPMVDLSPAWAAADILLQPTWYDPFSNACLEGLAAGLPVVTTRDNGFSELIEHGQTGSVIPQADATTETVAALRFWRDETASRPSEVRGRCFAAAVPWSTQRNARETLDILKRVAIDL